MNSEVSNFMVRVINFVTDGLPTQFKSSFQYSLRLEIITDTDNKLKLNVIMDLLAKTIIKPPKIILNIEDLFRSPHIYSRISKVSGPSAGTYYVLVVSVDHSVSLVTNIKVSLRNCLI